MRTFPLESLDFRLGVQALWFFPKDQRYLLEFGLVDAHITNDMNAVFLALDTTNLGSPFSSNLHSRKHNGNLVTK